MITPKLDENWDIGLDENNQISRVSGVEAIPQIIKERLLFFKEEWDYDLEAGVPWFQEIFVQPFNLVTAESFIKEEILNTPEVEELLEFDTDIDPRTRKLGITNFTVSTIYGQDISEEI